MSALRKAVLGAAFVGLIAIVALAILARAILALDAGYVWKATACFAAIAAILVARCQRHHPFTRFGAANHVTLARAVIVSLVTASIGESTSFALAASATGASLVALLLDGVDGWLARRTGLASDFGARFDMEVDALLILALAILVWQYDRAGVWIVLAGLLRYLFIAAGWVWPWMRRPLEPSVRRQAICVVQIAGLLFALAPIVSAAAAAPLAAIALATLLYSFLVDTVWLWRLHGREQVA